MRLFSGGPGSGKTTQSKRLAADFNLHHISMGNAIKDRFKRAQTDQANTLQRLSDTGGIISLDEVMEILELEMLRLNERESKPFIIHGFPRYMFQAIEYERDVSFFWDRFLFINFTVNQMDTLSNRSR